MPAISHPFSAFWRSEYTSFIKRMNNKGDNDSLSREGEISWYVTVMIQVFLATDSVVYKYLLYEKKAAYCLSG